MTSSPTAEQSTASAGGQLPGPQYEPGALKCGVPDERFDTFPQYPYGCDNTTMTVLAQSFMPQHDYALCQWMSCCTL